MGSEYEQQQAWWDSMTAEQKVSHMRDALHMSADEIRISMIEEEACRVVNARTYLTRDEWSIAYVAELAARGVIRENGYSRLADGES